MLQTATPTSATKAFTTVEQVGPEQAAEWLSNMAPNRTLGLIRVKAFANMMRNGQWIFDGAPIRFDRDGRLVDGQNRLTAVIEAEMVVPFVVVRGLAPEAMSVMDTGKARTTSDILKMAHPDVTDVHVTAALTRIIYLWEHGSRGGDLGRFSGARTPLPNAVLLDFYQQNREEIDHLVKESSRVYHGVPGYTRTVLGLALWVFNKIDTEDAAGFFEGLRTGVGLNAGNPILAARNRVMDIARGDRRRAIPNDEGMALLIKAWNAYREGRELRVLVFRRGGANPEQYPEPR